VDVSHSKGVIQKHIDIQTNDPKRPTAKVFIKATVKTLVDVQPQEQIRFTVEKGTLTAQELFLTADPSVKLGTPVASSKLISANLTPDKDGRQKLTVRLEQADQIGMQTTEVKIPVNGAIKEVTIPVWIHVRGPIQVTPKIVSFVLKNHPEEVVLKSASNIRQAPDPSAAIVEKMPAGRKLRVLAESNGWFQVITFETETTESVMEQRIGWIRSSLVNASKAAGLPDPQEVSIQIAKGRTFQVLDLRSTLPSIKVEKKSTTEPNKHALVVSLLKADRNQKGNLRGEIVVNTDNADQPQVKIPVFVNIL
jgi:hypothetical protein